MAPKWWSEAQVSCLQLLGFFYNCTAAHFYLERSFHFGISRESQFSRRLKKINLKPEKSNSEMLKIKHSIPLRFSNFIILICGMAEKGPPSWTLKTWFVIYAMHMLKLCTLNTSKPLKRAFKYAKWKLFPQLYWFIYCIFEIKVTFFKLKTFSCESLHVTKVNSESWHMYKAFFTTLTNIWNHKNLE